MPVSDFLQLSVSEACFVCDALHGQRERLHGERAAEVLDLALFNALDFDRRDVAWAVDGQAILSRMVTLSPLQAQSVVEAVRVFWSDESLPISDRLVFVGLVSRRRQRMLSAGRAG